MATRSKTIKIVKTITANDIDFMDNGGRVLLLGAGPFPGLSVTYQIMSGGRVNGNNSTVIHDHPLMRDFPHDGFCDWQFAPLFNNGGTIVFNELNIPFNPIVEIVSGYKIIRKQVSIFELTVGNGGILVCTFDLSSGDHAATNLYNVMLRYLQSGSFKPSVSVTAEWLNALSEQNKNITVDFTTDECYDTGGQIEV